MTAQVLLADGRRHRQSATSAAPAGPAVDEPDGRREDKHVTGFYPDRVFFRELKNKASVQVQLR